MYGSFSYGIESSIIQATLREIKVVTLKTESDVEFQKFLQLISDNPKGLVRIELKIFEAQSETQIPLCTLYTECAPEKIEHPDSQLLLRAVQGLHATDQNSWENTVTRIWPVASK